MTVGGLVITYAEDAGARAAAQALLEADPRLELGPREGLRQAVVASSEDARGGRDLCEGLLEHPGIVAVDVAFVGGLDTEAHHEGAREEDER